MFHATSTVSRELSPLKVKDKILTGPLLFYTLQNITRKKFAYFDKTDCRTKFRDYKVRVASVDFASYIRTSPVFWFTKLTRRAIYVWRNTVAPSYNHCLSGKATVLSICIVELHFSVNDRKALRVTQQRSYDDFTSPATINILRCSCKASDIFLWF